MEEYSEELSEDDDEAELTDEALDEEAFDFEDFDVRRTCSETTLLALDDIFFTRKSLLSFSSKLFIIKFANTNFK
jgi:hypothetical protein